MNEEKSPADIVREGQQKKVANAVAAAHRDLVAAGVANPGAAITLIFENLGAIKAEREAQRERDVAKSVADGQKKLREMLADAKRKRRSA
jgi:hypothetical protein